MSRYRQFQTTFGGRCPEYGFRDTMYAIKQMPDYFWQMRHEYAIGSCIPLGYDRIFDGVSARKARVCLASRARELISPLQRSFQVI